ncbi:MAG TPA: MFS transporter [Alphaproteobacteria bacterium]|nr:MFS transporter [Alphaproteobacteria bacterium]
MDIARGSIEKRVISWLCVLILIFGGLASFGSLGRLEDPEFTIKDAVVVTYYPGASAHEVELEVTDKIETAIQQLSQVKEMTSKSYPGRSEITVSMKDQYGKATLPQIWDELRRKVGDVQQMLPPGTSTSYVNDDFGDVYGIFLSLSGEGYDYRELKEEAKFLRRELSLVPGVSKVAIGGDQSEQIFIEVSMAKLSQLGLSINDIQNALQYKNLVSPSGAVKVESGSVRIETTGIFDSVDDIKDLLISKDGKSLTYLKDIANVYSGFDETPTSKIRVDGKQALTLGVSAASGENVVKVGKRIEARIAELDPQLPAGMQLEKIYFQPDYVSDSISNFVISLLQAVGIVILVLLLFMGLKSGLLIGSILLLTIFGTFIFMYVFAIDLQRISLGALIIAMGMLVDNAIVVTEGILVKVQGGQKAKNAATDVVKQTFWPLLGATIVGVLAFAGIGLSDDSTGEFCATLFYVILISLLLSWLLAVTLTPFFCDMVLKPKVKKEGEVEPDPYAHPIFVGYKAILMRAIKFRKMTVSGLIGLLVISMYGFGFIEQSFFPNSSTPMFYIHYWKPQGTDIRSTEKDMVEIENFIRKQDNVQQVSTFIGSGASRFMLTYSGEQPNPSYGIFIVKAENLESIQKILDDSMNYITTNYPDNEARPERLKLGPGGGQAIETRIIGEDPKILRDLSNQVEEIMYNSGKATSIRNDWRQQTKIINPTFLETQARNAGLTRPQINQALEMGFSGTQVGTFRNQDELIPITMRLPNIERNNIDSIRSMQVWSDHNQRYIPIEQLVDKIEPKWEDSLIRRKDRRRTITASADNIEGVNANDLFQELRPQIEAIKLPSGYSIEWGGEYENSTNAQTALFGNLPKGIGAMILVVILLFNAVKQPLIIWLCVPLAIIGVTFGLLLFNGSFGFMALLGFLSLMGMLIKNAVVLLDQIDLEIAEGKEHLFAVVDSSISRVRPVAMGAITTILGLVPLLADAFFVDMAITIMSGLTFATVLTLIIVPVLYTMFFKIKYRDEL